MRFPHVDRAHDYARRAVAGEIPACKWTKAACQRQIDDLARVGNDADWPYIFRPDIADRACRFVELLPHVKGQLAGKLIVLEDWQRFGICCVFGWVHRDSGRRRFREAYEEVPRKNAKSTKLGALALFMLSADCELGAEVYSAATTREQARIVFDASHQMAMRAPGYRQRFGIRVLRHSIIAPETGSRMLPLSADATSLDGLNVSCAVIDELHAHKTRHVYDVITTATGARTQPLIMCITTAGSNRAGICFERRDYLCSILNATLRDHDGLGYPIKGAWHRDETVWGIVYTIDDDDDPLSEPSWAKANPNLGISVDLDDIRRKAKQASRSPAALANFLTKHLDVWVNSDSAWMDMRKWDACADTTLRENDFAGQPCIVGLDAAFKTDIFAELHIYQRGSDICVFGKYYLPSARIEEEGAEHLRGWALEGRIDVTDGEVVDIEHIRYSLFGDEREPTAGICSRTEVKAIGYDPAQLTQFATECLENGHPMVEVRPSVLNFSEPMKWLEELVMTGRFRHNGDPILTWMVSNVVCHRDRKDNIYPNKDAHAKKIDGVIALLIGLRLVPQLGQGGNVYDERSLIVV